MTLLFERRRKIPVIGLLGGSLLYKRPVTAKLLQLVQRMTFLKPPPPFLTRRMITYWFFGRDPRTGNATRVDDPRLQAHRLVASSREVLDHEGAVLRHLGRVQLAMLLLLHCAKADVLHLVLLNLCTWQLSLTIFDKGFAIYLPGIFGSALASPR